MSATVWRQTVRFPSGEAECAAVLIHPADGPAGACVVLGHGFGAVKEGGPVRTGELLAEAGYSALAFDHRHLGESGGEPRQLIDIPAQLADWRAALEYVRSLDGIDPDRVAIWGSSYGGGHVIEVAAEDRRVAAAVAQGPHTDGIATLRALGPRNALRLTSAGLVDQLGSWIGRTPHTIPIVGPPGSIAAMTSEGAAEGYASMYDEGFDWVNEFAARAALRVSGYSPRRRARKVACPLLIQVAGNDLVTPPAAAIETAGLAPRGELIVYTGLGHFELYRGEHFKRALADQLEFLGRHLPAAA